MMMMICADVCAIMMTSYSSKTTNRGERALQLHSKSRQDALPIHGFADVDSRC